MASLDQLFLSRTRAAVLRLLFGLNRTELHVRAIERGAGLTVGAVREELRKLAAMDLVLARRDGNRLYYTANHDHPLYADLRSVVLKTAGLGDVLREALAGAAIRVAFVFGSMASREERASSDLDLMVIGRLGLREVSRRLMGSSDRIGREVNAVVMEPAEFENRRAQGDPFIMQVLSRPKHFIIGGPRELEAVE
ncbi:MAG: toxin-antitoxin system toxin subunit [Candidatus Riflebacteria bacterium]|nr:toxin-antitoxin system toxin subunit [Candidatus Riflebacteria bacterium]